MEEMEKKVNEAEKKKSGTLQYPVVGKSRPVDQLIKTVAKLGKLRQDVAIWGEPGVGKGTIAKNIYSQGLAQRPKEPLVSLNLSALADAELDAILFGTDAGTDGLPSGSRKGLLDVANGGTVLIEEIEEASLRDQMKILNVMNERASRQQAEGGDVPVDVRFIITMAEDPKTLVTKRKLLEELYGKIAGFEMIYVPPLRERPEDIPLLVKHFASALCRELGMAELAIDINAIDVLVRQPWKENIRELKAVVDRSVLFSTGGRFMLPPELVDEKTEVVKMITNIESGQDFVLENSLDVIEKGIIERALQRFGHNQSRAAGFLGLTEQTLRYKLKRLGIVSSRARSN
ncbi:MAG: sigma 54-interacting transcriptional regulator [Bacteroidota bacterium]|jgi:DNA-binding NtrC family response regulator